MKEKKIRKKQYGRNRYYIKSEKKKKQKLTEHKKIELEVYPKEMNYNKK